jgi:microcystin-dependent protein
MAVASVTNSFVSGTPATASAVNQNFADVVNFLNGQVIHKDASVQFASIPSVAAGVPVSAGDLVTKSYVDTTIVPSGTIVMWGGTVAPDGWLLLQGQAVSRVTYAPLFAVFGTAYGVGDGVSTFNLPDLRSRFPVGLGSATWSDARGETGGSADAVVVTHNHTQNSHNHTQNAHGHGTITTSSAGAHTHQTRGFVSRGTTSGETTMTINQNNVSLANSFMESAGAHTHTVVVGNATATNNGVTATNNAAGESGTNKNLPPYITLNFMVKV